MLNFLKKLFLSEPVQPLRSGEWAISSELAERILHSTSLTTFHSWDIPPRLGDFFNPSREYYSIPLYGNVDLVQGNQFTQERVCIGNLTFYRRTKVWTLWTNNTPRFRKVMIQGGVVDKTV